MFSSVSDVKTASSSLDILVSVVSRTMSSRAVALLAVLCCGWHTHVTADCHECEVVARISSGPICGSVAVAEETVKYYAFTGIPYAKPPTGARRFAELEKCDPWKKPLHTVEEGPACPQLDIIYGSIPVQPKGMEEDCMYANVYTPVYANFNCTEEDSKGLPILVNVHGGGFQAGSGNADLHGPEYFMYKGKVIVMSFNYRIAVFGYLSLGSDKIPGNNGLRDIVFFLKWVQENARAFGGDPKNVTLIGQSVGAASVHLLTLSKAAEGLFHRGIMISGTAIPNFYSASPTYASYLADIFLEAAGINATDPDVIHQQLIEMPLDDIMYANSIAQYATGLTTFVPVVESDHPNFTKILDDEPLTLIEQGRGANIPLIVGFTNNEGVFFRRPLIFLDLLDRVRSNDKVVLSPRLNFGLSERRASKIADKIVHRYFNGSYTIDTLVRLISDTFFVYPAIKWAQFRSAIGGASLYLYEYSYESINSIMKRALWEKYEGAAHVEDFTFLFRTNTLENKNVSFPPCNEDDYMKVWLLNFTMNFIDCDNPTCTDDAESPWPPADYTQLQLQSIAEPRVLRMTDPSEYYKDMVNFFDRVDPDLRELSRRLNIGPL